ncbi:hypothetical protein EDI_037880 [Entamoeba dispar SAW760]|uniref:Uncharacterized protein n=1 Tax=Entamoeba dispar (strain ATCC PRA-260 / SAW760) TaxID=370354 RepID=B0ERJ1_ENTDS|nr:uncharacterized protein EDI_037880 [Entamoeba dispar SAW760]EDR22849.1 hypothetical protein EDI_037880 [Entamoeba dispar SAW760]|eukprot:EDR22849.1 hypothetical protein EDI_037880 [Entamoeba dispar SAW760]
MFPQYLLIEGEYIYFKNFYSNCIEIDTNGKCIVCHYGYHLVGDNCLRNSSGYISYKNDTCLLFPSGTRINDSNDCICLFLLVLCIRLSLNKNVNLL